MKWVGVLRGGISEKSGEERGVDRGVTRGDLGEAYIGEFGVECRVASGVEGRVDIISKMRWSGIIKALHIWYYRSYIKLYAYLVFS